MSNRQHTKAMDLVFSKVEEGDDVFTVEGIASSIGNEDVVGDVMVEGAFDATIRNLKAQRDAKNKKSLIPLLFNHQMDVVVGTIVDLSMKSDKLFMKATMPKDDTFVRDRLTPQMRIGSIEGLSIGFRASKYNTRRDDSGRAVGYDFHEVAIHEISLTPFPANPVATGASVKSERLTSDDLADLDVRELEGMLKSGTPLSGKLAKRLAGLLIRSEEARDVSASTNPDVAQRDVDPSSMQDLLNILTGDSDHV